MARWKAYEAKEKSMTTKTTKPTENAEALDQPIVTQRERGWAGHFICADRCRFRRNTLLECGEVRVVVSSVGLMENLRKTGEGKQRFDTVGFERYFETIAFHAVYDGRYWDADVSQKIGFDSPWCVSEWDADDTANDQHDAVVAEIAAKIKSGEITSG